MSEQTNQRGIWQQRRVAVPELNFKRPRDRRGGGPTGAVLSLLYRGHEAYNGESTAMLLKFIPGVPVCLLACLPVCLPACLVICLAYVPVPIFHTIVSLRSAPFHFA